MSRPPDGSGSGGALTAEVEAILKRRASSADKPNDADLVPVYKYLSATFPPGILPDGDSSSASRTDVHWFCAKQPVRLVADAATFLVFLFAFKRVDRSKHYVDSLEVVLRGCERCARAFGGARRDFSAKYLAHFPSQARTNFFAAVDRWQSEFILTEHKKDADHYGSSSSTSAQTLFNLPTPILQLLFSEPSLLADESLSNLIDSSIALEPYRPQSGVAGPGLSPVLVKLLSAENERRRAWALAQLPLTSRNPISFAQWCDSGTGIEVQALFSGRSGRQEDRWTAIGALLRCGGLGPDAIDKGLLGGSITKDGRSQYSRGIMSVLSGVLGSDHPSFPSILECFSLLLASAPLPDIWAFDTSAELPHTLFSEIKNNRAFVSLLEDRLQVTDVPPAASASAKGKQKAYNDNDWSLAWMTPFLLSLRARNSDGLVDRSRMGPAFGETLAKVANFCFSEMQHSGYTGDLRAGLAKAGLDTLRQVQLVIPEADHTAHQHLSATLDIHASFVTTCSFRSPDAAVPAWGRAREAASDLLTDIFTADSRLISSNVLQLGEIAVSERKRASRARAARKAGMPPPEPIRASHLRRTAVRKELWTMAYSALGPGNVSGAAILLRSVAVSAHIEKLNRNESWCWKDPSKNVDLSAVIPQDEWIESIRSINAALQSTRDQFSRTIESLAIQPDPEVTRSLWDIPAVARAAIMLLLSPASDVHEPLISLIQQSFDDVDDRGDCFRVLLQKYPAQAMDGLAEFLTTFVQTASKTPESCSLAKWLVRCFTDILDALCQSSHGSDALLQSRSFLSVHEDGKSMPTRISLLWHLMTTALAVIFKRTSEWAVFFENSVMVDWMRDALIFGRQMADRIRSFEAAALGHTSDVFVESQAESALESPRKVTSVGRKMVQRLEVVLQDLVSWFRLTDLETLHQTFELVKTILSRVQKTNPNLEEDAELKSTLETLDKYCRKSGRSFTSRLSDDLLSELSDLLLPFNLDLGDDEIQFVSMSPRVKQEPTTATSSRSSAQRPMTPSSEPEMDIKPDIKRKDAFQEMMNRAKGSQSSTRSSQPGAAPKTETKPSNSSTKSGSQNAPIEVEDLDADDDFLDNLSAGDLDIIEQRAKITEKKGSSVTSSSIVKPRSTADFPFRLKPGQQSATIASSSSSRLSGATKAPARPGLNINVVPKPTAKSTGFKSSIMRELRKDFRQEQQEMRRQIGGITPRLPTASTLGTGLGAHVPKAPTRPARPMGAADSESSASEDSDDGGGLSQLLKKHKSPLKPARIMPAAERRPVKVINDPRDSYNEAMREKERRQARQHAIKMRLRPDYNPFYRYILGWDPTHTDPTPPHPPSFTQDLLTIQSPVPRSFPSAKAYERTMLPLFLQEVWSQFLNSRDVPVPVEVEVSMRSYEDDFLDIELNITRGLPDRFTLNEMDIVILRQSGNPRQTFAKVQGFRRKFKDATVKVRILASRDIKELATRSKWDLIKHSSLTTAMREFGALKGLPYYEPELLSFILEGRSAATPYTSEYQMEDAQKAFDVNEPQAKAILGSMNVEGFSLIQGPPGTGKTKTISGLVGKWMSDRSGKIARPGEVLEKSKLLVCAPSNAAIDEVCKRLMNGVPSTNGRRLIPSIVRIGNDTAVNDAVKDVSLDNLVEAKVSASVSGRTGGGEYERIQQELDEVKAKIRSKQDDLKTAQNHDEKRKAIENELHALVTRRTQLGQASSKAKDAARDQTRHLDGARRAAREAVLKDADIICATLSGSGHESLAPYTFETVIIDEAAQAIELSCLIPLKYGCRRCIMVGDPNQLPPTTFSTQAEKCNYNESLFVRMTKRSNANVQLLSIQYRMHPFISELPSKVFYDSRLKDGPDMAKKTAAVWHSRDIFGPYRFFNVNGVESKRGPSTYNADEAHVAVELYRRLEADFGHKVNLSLRIGVITMYREQLLEMRRAFNAAFGPEILQKVEFNTVDGFQGQEKDIVILSCVRSGPNLSSIGFLKDPRRMNVALTRAKSSLFIIGNGPTLERSDDRWKTIVGDARDRGFFIDYNARTFAAPISNDPPAVPKPKVKKTSSNGAASLPTKADRPSDKAPKRKPEVGAAGDAKRPKKDFPPPKSPVKRRRSLSTSSSSSTSSSGSSSSSTSTSTSEDERAKKTTSSALPRPSAPSGKKPVNGKATSSVTAGPARTSLGDRPVPPAAYPPMKPFAPARTSFPAAGSSRPPIPTQGPARPPIPIQGPPRPPIPLQGPPRPPGLVGNRLPPHVPPPQFRPDGPSRPISAPKQSDKDIMFRKKKKKF